MIIRKLILIALVMTFGLSAAWAQEPTTPAMPEVDHSQMDHGAKSEKAPAAGLDMGGMGHGSMQGGVAPPDARDPHAYSGGHDFGPTKLRLADTHNFGSLLVDNLESAREDGNTSTAYDLQAWYGRTYNRVVLKAEGHVDGGKTEAARSELLWGHAISAFWDTQLGVRYDSGAGPNRSWLAIGVQGLAPYWFEVDAAAYLGDGGRSGLRLEVEYELLLTQQLILQPRVEADVYGKRDVERGLGSGLSEVTAELRLRYEIRREFAPYLGVEWARKFGGTEDRARVAGKDPKETRLVAGLRFWF
jgi:copper resistance protein B